MECTVFSLQTLDEAPAHAAAAWAVVLLPGEFGDDETLSRWPPPNAVHYRHFGKQREQASRELRVPAAAADPSLRVPAPVQGCSCSMMD